MLELHMRKYIWTICLLILGVALAGAPALAVTCGDLKDFETTVNITLDITEPTSDLTKSRRHLIVHPKSASEYWIKKNHLDMLWHIDDMKISGVISVGWNAAYKNSVKSILVDRINSVHCVYFEDVNIELSFRTMIFAPKEFYSEDGCAFKVIKPHVLKHHEISLQAIEKYTDKLRNDIQEIIAMTESDYVGNRVVKLEVSAMTKRLEEVVKIYIEESVANEMARTAPYIDTPEEYDAGKNALQRCPVIR